MSTADRLADALKAQAYYDDYCSPLAMPIAQLVADCRVAGLNDIAERAINGDFDATEEESDAWAASEEGQATFSELLGQDPQRGDGG